MRPHATGGVSDPGPDVTPSRPPALAAPREPGPDDLKRIKGIGPKLEELLYRLGYYHYHQLAGWTPEEIAWVDENLEDFRGRVVREGWVEQARVLAEEGQTEFSIRVDRRRND
jgi:NADH-quinone oxidoreductase subunit E